MRVERGATGEEEKKKCPPALFPERIETSKNLFNNEINIKRVQIESAFDGFDRRDGKSFDFTIRLGRRARNFNQTEEYNRDIDASKRENRYATLNSRVLLPVYKELGRGGEVEKNKYIRKRSASEHL